MEMSVRRLLLVLAASMTLTACSASSGGGAPPAAGIPVCESLPVIAPPEGAFKDSPIYVGNDMPEDEIGEWARTKPAFEQLWIDREHAGWVVVAFSSDVAARQAELAEAFPGAGAVAIEVDWRMADLERLQQRVSDELQSQFDSLAVGIDVMRGRVDVGIGVLSEDRISVVSSRFAGERVCVSGLAPADAIPEGPQPAGGQGWRLLASEKLGEAYRTGIAADQESYRALWQGIGLAGEPPAVDFRTQVVIWLGAVYGSSCPDIRLDAVVSDVERRLVHGTIVLPSIYNACTADANPHAFVVAVERSTLPAPPFGIQLNAEDPPAGAPEERTIVETDLREPGSTPGSGEVHLDPNLPEPYVVEPESIIEPDVEVPFRLDVRCGIEWLGPLSDYWWKTPVPAGSDRFVPVEWEPLVEDGKIIVSVLMEGGPEPTVTATAAGHSIVYRVSRDAPAACT
jgi:hypothetical protein